jgi:transcription-repair coupling factor (superfamily II helicase)
MVQFFADLKPRPTVMPRPRHTVSGITGGAKAYFLARLFVECGVSLVVVTPDAHQRDVLYDDLQGLLPGMPDAPLHWQGLESVVCRYLHQAPLSADVMAFQQHQALVSYQPLWRLLGDDPVVVVMAAESLRYGVLPPHQLQSCLLPVHIGASFSLSELAAALVERGYCRVSMVETVGEFALREGILDVISPGQTHPVRIEFFGDDVESIRAFDVQSQTSTATLQTVVIAPVFPLGRQQGQRQDGVTRLRAHLATQGWSEASITARFDRWQEQLPSAWPWGIATFFYDPLCSPLAYLPATSLLCGVDVEGCT